MSRSLGRRVIQGVLQRDPETGVYIATAPAIPGCVTEGDSVEDARRSLKEAAEGYLEVLALEGADVGEFLDSETSIVPISLELAV